MKSEIPISPLNATGEPDELFDQLHDFKMMTGQEDVSQKGNRGKKVSDVGKQRKTLGPKNSKLIQMSMESLALSKQNKSQGFLKRALTDSRFDSEFSIKNNTALVSNRKKLEKVSERSSIQASYDRHTLKESKSMERPNDDF